MMVCTQLSSFKLMSFYVSAPGKVILFGEHLAVYGKPAIAAAISLRAYLLVTPTGGDLITLEFPDINLTHTWKTAQIPWVEISKRVKLLNNEPVPTDELDQDILGLFSELLAGITDPLHYTACRCFLYLFVHLCKESVTGYHFCIRLTLPIGAGLGSSASTAVCLSSALSILGKHVSVPTSKALDADLPDVLADSKFIDDWSLIGEKCFHGNPSGIDNAVATNGGAILYQKLVGDKRGSARTTIRDFGGLRLLLTHTKVPRSTAELVGGVATLGKKSPAIFTPIIDAMGELASEAHMHIVENDKMVDKLSSLVSVNHGLLSAIGVSHPKLEQIKIIADELALGATKLTGAGGGGCAITLLKEELGDEQLNKARRVLSEAGFETFSVVLGGKGVGMLSSDNFDGKVFSPELLLGFESREAIETAIGGATEWRYW